MTRLDLKPLPCANAPEPRRSEMVSGLGFVDDAVILTLLGGGSASRISRDSRSLALASDEMDYAGWPRPPVPGRQF
jgi:hypothetical protein